MVWNIQSALWIGLGGFLGTVLRYGAITWVPQHLAFSGSATLAVNILGSFMAGIALSWAHRLPETFLMIFTVGFLGGFTTFSAFSVEAITFLRKSQWLELTSYVSATLILGFLFCGCGFGLGNFFLNQISKTQ